MTFKSQSFTGNSPHLYKPPRHNQNDDGNMQLLTRRVILNLTKALHVRKLPAVENASCAILQHYSTGPPKQKLLNYPTFPLDETMSKFVCSTQPLLTEEEFDLTQKSAHEFLKDDGAELQKLLEKAASSESNWLAHRWLRAAYMQYRDPVTVYSSPGMTFPLTEFKSEAEYVLYASKLIYGLIKYKELIDGGKIPVVKMGKFELDNSQFGKVYGTCRIPMPNEDCMQYNPDSDYVVVIYKNHFYKLYVYNNKCVPLHPDALAAELQCIRNTERKKGFEFGLLTTDNRDNWASAYEVLTKSEENRVSVEKIQKSMFTVSLDECVPDEKNKKFNVLSEQLIHGGGTEQNSANRWMDKTIQVIVNPNGMSGFTYEHSPAEGQPIALMTDYLVKNLNDEEHYKCAAKDDYKKAEKIHLTTNKCLDSHMATAGRNVNKLATDLQMQVLHYEGFGKNFLKSQKLSPDSFIQMALQYAFYKLHKVAGAQYESAHLRIYKGGRTETIRSCSNESLAFAKAMTDANAKPEMQVELLRAAVNNHREYTMMALQGRGVDRHLLGLKLMAIENQLPIPHFYKTPGFVKSAHFRISTSQVASANLSFMAYGPSVHDGYGCCYNPRNDDMLFAVSAWHSNSVTDGQKYASAIKEALDNMWQLLLKYGEKPKAKL